MKESDVQKQILDYLKLKRVLCFKHRNVGIFKKATNQYIPLAFGERGISDILGCLPDGRFLAIEVKNGKDGKPTEDQLEFLKQVMKRGGIGFIARSLDDVIQQIP